MCKAGAPIIPPGLGILLYICVCNVRILIVHGLAIGGIFAHAKVGETVGPTQHPMYVLPYSDRVRSISVVKTKLTSAGKIALRPTAEAFGVFAVTAEQSCSTVTFGSVIRPEGIKVAYAALTDTISRSGFGVSSTSTTV